MGKYGTRKVVDIEQRTKDLTDFIVRMVNSGTAWGPVATSMIDVVIKPVARKLVVDYGIDPDDKTDYSALEAGVEELLLDYSLVQTSNGRLGFSAPCQRSFDKALEICPTYEVRHESALRQIVVAVNSDKAAGLEGASFQDFNYLAKLFEVMGARGQLYRTPTGEAEEKRQKAAAQDEVERNQLVAAILLGKSTYPILQYGQTRAQSGDHLQKESVETLRSILATVTQVRNMKKETREQQKQRLHDASVAAGHVDQPSRDSLDGIAPSGNAPSQQVSSTQPYGNQDHLFRTDPENPNSPYLNRNQLLKIAKNDRNRWRLLMSSDLNKLNSLLAK